MTMNRLSCHCDGCLDRKGCSEREGIRPPDVDQILYEIHNQTGDHESANEVLKAAGLTVLQKAKVGDMVGVFVPMGHRVGGDYGADKELWASGRFMVGQLAEEVGKISNAGTKRRESAGAMVKLYLPEEVEGLAEHSFLYPNPDICRKEGDIVAVGGCVCGKKHFTSVPVALVRGGPWPIDDLVVGDEDDDEDDDDNNDDEQGNRDGRVGCGGQQTGLHNRRRGGTRVPAARGYKALQKIYASRRGMSETDPSKAQKVVLPVGVRGSFSNNWM